MGREDQALRVRLGAREDRVAVEVRLLGMSHPLQGTGV